MASRPPPPSGVSEVMKMQEQIRRNALETSASLKELGSWQKDIKKTDKKLVKLGTSGPGKVVPVRVRGGTVRVSSSGGRVAPRSGGSATVTMGSGGSAGTAAEAAAKAKAKAERRAARAARRAAKAKAEEERVAARKAAKEKEKIAASHVYDKGYDKWQKFDVDKALQDESESDDDAKRRAVDDDSSSSSSSSDDGGGGGGGAPALHPSLMHAPAKVVADLKKGKAAGSGGAAEMPVASAGPPQEAADRERYEREVGNECYKAGDFTEAVKHYTRCIAINPRNVLALSNRAMAFLKTKQHLKAERDCSAALRVDPGHVKSLTRRATARNDTGRHHHALADYQAAAVLDPSSKLVRSELRKTTDKLRSAIRNAPRRALPLQLAGAGEEVRPEVAGPLGPQATTRPEGRPAAVAASGGEVAEAEAALATTPVVELIAEVEPASVPVAPAAVQELDVAAPVPAEAQKAPRRVLIDEDSDEDSEAAADAPAPAPPAPTPAPAPRKRVISTKPAAPRELVTPKTSYEFQRVWRELAGEAKADQRAAYLALLKPSALPKLLGDALDTPLLIGIIEGAVAAYLQGSSAAAPGAKKALKVFTHLAKVSRFSMTAMFLGAGEKAVVGAAFDALEAASAEGDGAEAVRSLRATYGV